MKHAGADALARLADLLDALRGLPGLKERSPGVFYRTGRAFLHFHDDPAGLFADVRIGSGDFERFAVTSTTGQTRLIEAVHAALDGQKTTHGRKSE